MMNREFLFLILVPCQMVYLKQKTHIGIQHEIGLFRQNNRYRVGNYETISQRRYVRSFLILIVAILYYKA